MTITLERAQEIQSAIFHDYDHTADATIEILLTSGEWFAFDELPGYLVWEHTDFPGLGESWVEIDIDHIESNLPELFLEVLRTYFS